MVFVFLEGYASGAPPYTTCPDANGSEATPRSQPQQVTECDHRPEDGPQDVSLHARLAMSLKSVRRGAAATATKMYGYQGRLRQ